MQTSGAGLSSEAVRRDAVRSRGRSGEQCELRFRPTGGELFRFCPLWFAFVQLLSTCGQVSVNTGTERTTSKRRKFCGETQVVRPTPRASCNVRSPGVFGTPKIDKT